MKFVHAADLHVDSPMRGLDRYEGAPLAALRGATRRALENLVGLCIDERAAFLLLAGDVYDGSWKDFSTGLFFASQMARLKEAGIPVVLVRGNHDAASHVARQLRLPDNVHELSHRRPETFEVPGTNACVHGMSFPTRATTDDLTTKYPDATKGALNIGLLHTCMDGREGHERYAPTTLDRLKSKGYDYWALGHVHAREVLAKEPWIVFPGNLQGRHVREPGAKGASLVTVEDGAIASVEHRALDVVRWDSLPVDLASAANIDDAIDLVRAAIARAAEGGDGRVLAARIVATGQTRANAALRSAPDRFANEVRAAANEDGAVWVEKVVVSTRPNLDVERVREESSAIGHLARRLDAIKKDPSELASLAAVLADLDKKLPAELREGEGALVLDDPEVLRGIVDDVEAALLSRLLSDGSTAS